MAQQVIPPEALKDLPKKFNIVEKQIQTGGFRNPSYQTVQEPDIQGLIPIQEMGTALGRPSGTMVTTGYKKEITWPNMPTVDPANHPMPKFYANYDAQGNFIKIQPENPYQINNDIVIHPEINANGELVNANPSSAHQNEGGFGSFVGGALKDFAPMIAAGLGANYLIGSGLLGGAGAATGAVEGATAANALGGAVGAGSADLLASLTPAQAASAGLLSSAAGSGSPLAGVGTGATGAEIAGGAGAVGAGTGAGAGVTAPIMPENAGGLLGGGSTALTGGVAPEVGAITAPTIGQMANSSSIVDAIASATGLDADTIKKFAPSAIQGLLSAGGSYLQSSSAKDAAQIQADAQIRAAQIAADAARFRPVGVTTRFGTSNFTTDAAGNVTGAGYTPSAEITGYQNRLSNLANQGLTGAEQAPAAYAPLTGAAQSLFNLGQGYLKKTPEEVAADYIAKQQALLAPSQEQQLALLQNKLQAQGRGGLSVAQGGNLGATIPEMQAYYNALAQSNLQLAANANQAGQQNVQFGAGLFNTGAGLQNQYYQGQVAAYSPFTNAMDITSGLERLAQQPMDLGTSIGQKVSTANANVGQLTGQGIMNAAQTMAPANAYSMGGNILSGAASSPAVTSALNKAFGNTQQPTQQQYTYDPNTKQFVPVQSSSVWG